MITIGKQSGNHKWMKLNSHHVCTHCKVIAYELKIGQMTLKRGTNPIKTVCQLAPIKINFAFIEIIKDEYSHIMSNTQNELYEIKDFVLPDFQGRLKFVLNYYNVQQEK